MQDLINLSLSEMWRDEREWELGMINQEGGRRVRGRNGREAVAKALMALAARIAPTVMAPMPPTKTRAVAR
jgi:hypothetical protein